VNAYDLARLLDLPLKQPPPPPVLDTMLERDARERADKERDPQS